MNNRERTLAVLHYEDYDRLPVVHMGFWVDTLQKWATEGHLTPEEAGGWGARNPIGTVINKKLGFDFCWGNWFSPLTQLYPPIVEEVLEVLPDGSTKILNKDGAIVIKKEGITCIPTEVDHLLKGRREWEEIFLPRLQFSGERITSVGVSTGTKELRFVRGGLDYLRQGAWENPTGLFCGSLYGVMRNWLGLVGSSYLQVDNPGLFDEIIDTVGELCLQCVRAILEMGAKFDFAHFWEDICFKSGPLINPTVFQEKVGPHYKRITDLVGSHGIDIVSLDCDGKIDDLVPIWLNNGVNIMFPIEVGTWDASIKPWREKYGRDLLGVGGMDKRVLAYDFSAIDAEIERLKPLVELGGFIPCVDHKIPPNAKWENVQYYCDRMRATFG